MSSDSHHRGSGSIAGYFSMDLWWIKWLLLFFQYFGPPSNPEFTRCSLYINQPAIGVL
jgi:hypothetical protein